MPAVHRPPRRTPDRACTGTAAVGIGAVVLVIVCCACPAAPAYLCRPSLSVLKGTLGARHGRRHARSERVVLVVPGRGRAAQRARWGAAYSIIHGARAGTEGRTIRGCRRLRRCTWLPKVSRAPTLTRTAASTVPTIQPVHRGAVSTASGAPVQRRAQQLLQAPSRHGHPGGGRRRGSVRNRHVLRSGPYGKTYVATTATLPPRNRWSRPSHLVVGPPRVRACATSHRI